MPMFYTPKPRQFHYTPRFYDPEKEEWEALKTKYRIENNLPLDDEKRKLLAQQESDNQSSASDSDLDYFKQKVKRLDSEDRSKNNHLTWRDLFRKREVPQFKYVSRFDQDGNLIVNPENAPNEVKYPQKRIVRRFENDTDDRYKRISPTKILISLLAVFLLLLWIFSN